jgi:hypothetical protein
MTRYFFVGLLLLFTLISNASASPVESTIVPGKKLGPISLGMTLAEIEETLGAPTEAHPSQHFYIWHPKTPSGPLMAILGANDKVVEVKVFWDVYYTTSDLELHTGMIESDVRSILGRPRRIFSWSHYRVLYYRGINFTIDVNNNNIVTGVGVMPNSASIQAARYNNLAPLLYPCTVEHRR